MYALIVISITPREKKESTAFALSTCAGAPSAPVLPCSQGYQNVKTRPPASEPKWLEGGQNVPRAGPHILSIRTQHHNPTGGKKSARARHPQRFQL